MNKDNEDRQWHRLSPQETLNALGVSEDNGLTPEECRKRREKYGLNILPREKKLQIWRLLLSQFKSPLIYILLAAGVITFVIHSPLDTAVILTAAGVNIAIGFYQEFSSNKLLEKLSQIVKITARVRRGGRVHEIDSQELVPGDIILIKGGMKIPADARLLFVKELRVNESLLTGESATVKKHIKALEEEAVLGDRKNVLFMGTMAEKGEGTAVVVQTGAETELGRIANLTKKEEGGATPLQKRISYLGRLIASLVLIATAVILIIGILEKMDFVQLLVTALAVAVAAIPEGLPAAIAVILAVSSRRILKTNGLVKNLVAAESLGSTSVICMDKTGTLTEGKMKVKEIIGLADTEKILVSLALANEAVIDWTDGDYKIRGEATDQAKMRAALEAGLSPDNLLKARPQINFLPFDSSNRYIASFHKLENGKVGMFVSGAPEVLIRTSNFIEKDGQVQSFDNSQKSIWKIRHEELAGEGLRLLAAAYKELDESVEEIYEKNDEQLKDYVYDLFFLGLVSLSDPLRPEVKKIMNEVREAGLRLVIITGDHKLTATAIGRELGLPVDDSAVMEGDELDKISNEQLKEHLRDIYIFARINPEHKLRIVKAWKETGESVAVTGDGVNDAPALKAGDVGVALGSGTDIAKEASDLVLLDDSFVTIVEAIKQGRTAFANIKKVGVFLLSHSFTELVLILSALVLKLPLPLTAAQILWTNLAEDGLPNLALAFEPPEKDVMKQKPLKRRRQIFNTPEKLIAYPLGLATDILLLGSFFLLLKFSSYPLEYIRTFIFAALGTDSFFYISGLKSMGCSVFKASFFNNKYFIFSVLAGFVIMGLAVYHPFFNTLLKTQPLLPSHLFLIVGFGLFKLMLVELVKWSFNKKPKIASN